MTLAITTAVCGHSECGDSAVFLVWTSHYATKSGLVECKGLTGLLCEEHARQIEAHWSEGIGGELLCGCVVGEDDFSVVALAPQN